MYFHISFLFFLFDNDYRGESCSNEYLVWEALYTNIGKGRGRHRSKKVSLMQNDIYSQWMNDPKKFQLHLHIDHNIFHIILEEIRRLVYKKMCPNTLMSLENQLILCLLFVISYPSSRQLGLIFGVSVFVVSTVISHLLPYLFEYFQTHIPNKLVSLSHSFIGKDVRCIIDNTIHRTTKPTVNQADDYNGHYRMHGRQTQLLIDFDGNVIAYVTNLKGKMHDVLVASHNELFVDILGTSYALGDPAYFSVGYVVSGFKSCQLNTLSKRVFDRITRSEQVLIENVNKFIKDCRSINKLDAFRHGESKLLACVTIAIGLYNMKRKYGCFL